MADKEQNDEQACGRHKQKVQKHGHQAAAPHKQAQDADRTVQGPQQNPSPTAFNSCTACRENGTSKAYSPLPLMKQAGEEAFLLYPALRIFKGADVPFNQQLPRLNRQAVDVQVNSGSPSAPPIRCRR